MSASMEASLQLETVICTPLQASREADNPKKGVNTVKAHARAEYSTHEYENRPLSIPVTIVPFRHG